MLNEKFRVFIKSSFGRDKQNELFEFIWENYRKKISFYISNMVPRSDPHFEDLFQEVMFKIYSNLQNFNPVRSFKAWIYQISRNHCLDYLKSHSRGLGDASELQDKEIAFLRFSENLKYREISQTIGLNLNTTKARTPRFSVTCG